MFFNQNTGNLLLSPSGGLLQAKERTRSGARSAGNSAYYFPNIPGAIGLAFFIRGSDFTNANGRSMFVFDNRDTGQAYWYTSGYAGVSIVRVDGVNPPNATVGLADLAGNAWRKVYLEADSVANTFHLGNRFSNAEFLNAFDISEVTLYNRHWTNAELSDTSAYFPESGIIAKYPCAGLVSAGGLPYIEDKSGNEFHARIIGDLPTFF